MCAAVGFLPAFEQCEELMIGYQHAHYTVQVKTKQKFTVFTYNISNV